MQPAYNRQHRDGTGWSGDSDLTPTSTERERIAAVTACIERLGATPDLIPAAATCVPVMASALERMGRADRALALLERFAQRTGDGPGLVRALAADPRLADVLMVLLAGSPFLSEILLRHPEYLPRLRDVHELAQALTEVQLQREADECLTSAADPAEALDRLRRLQRWHILRIGVCDLVGLLDLPAVTGQLSLLADGLIGACLQWAAQETGSSPQGLTVLALGKLGGGELNYSSDIDLVLVAREDPGALGRLGTALIDGLARVTGEGFLYRVDMRLRPWGSVGPLVSSVEGYERYVRREARLWEKQALLKARPVAGDIALGEQLLGAIRPLIWTVHPDDARRDILTMKQRIERELRVRGAFEDAPGVDVKRGIGSIRDVEFVTQYLQLLYGADHPRVRSHNTLQALAALADLGFLSPQDHRSLADGYTFLRPIEHYVQIMHYRQTHALPERADELDALARRLGFQADRDADPAGELLARYRQHSLAIRSVFQRYVQKDPRVIMPDTASPAPNVEGHVSRMAPSYVQVFDADEVRLHAEMVERLGGGALVHVAARPAQGDTWRVTIVGLDYPAELSLICGLLFVYGLNILDGHVFTYEPQEPTPPEAGARARPVASTVSPTASREARRKIVDVFTVQPTVGAIHAELWASYQQDLEALLRRVEQGDLQGAQGALAKRLVGLLSETAAVGTLPPITITIDNETSDRYTVLDIEARDTPGFLYEFSNALALQGLHISRVNVASVGDMAYDRFYLTDRHGRRIEDPAHQRELRATTVLVKHFTHLLPHSPNPEAALLHFREFLARLMAHSDWPDELTSLENPEVLGALTRLLGVSEFLWDDFLRMQHANLFPIVRDIDALEGTKSRAQLQSDLDKALSAAADLAAKRAALNAFKDRETFRVDMRHILGHIVAFGQFSAELTDVCEVVVAGAYRLCYEHLAGEFGEPRQADGSLCPMAVCALGKCGGRELGYASDIELLFVYAGEGQTEGPTAISTADFYNRLVICFLDSIRAKREGIFEIDLRLRPYGQAGSLAVPLEAFERYFGLDGAAWAYERQALVKLRPIAGHAALGGQVAAIRDRIVYNPAAFDRSAIKAMRERQLRHLVAGGTVNAKYSAGGLVDIEYLVQGLQMLYGGQFPELRCTNTREAIERLGHVGVLTLTETAQLRQAHIFVRQLIDALRMVRGNARDLTVPISEAGEVNEEFAFLARRLGYKDDTARLRGDLDRYLADVRHLAGLLEERTGGRMRDGVHTTQGA